MLTGFPILVGFGNQAAGRNPEKSLRRRRENYLRLKANLICQSRYSLTSTNGCEEMQDPTVQMMITWNDASCDGPMGGHVPKSLNLGSLDWVRVHFVHILRFNMQVILGCLDADLHFILVRLDVCYIYIYTYMEIHSSVGMW